MTNGCTPTPFREQQIARYSNGFFASMSFQFPCMFISIFQRLYMFGVVWCLLSVSVGSLQAEPQSQTVLVHYMPWYASQPVSGHWGWHWTMGKFDPETRNANGLRRIASHDYPLIGPYDSNDPDLLECHVLLMKYAGIDGVVIDWYGLTDFRDYAEINRNSKHLIQHLKRAGLKFAICYEDQTVKHLTNADVIKQNDAVQHGVEVLQWLGQNWFADEAYVKIQNQPVLLIFGPQYFEKQQWQQILAASSERPLLFGLPHLTQATGMDGAFGWPPVTGNREITPPVWKKYLAELYQRSEASQPVIGVAFPGFQDFYQQAGLHESYGSIAPRDGATFTETLTQAQESQAEILQIATWNDFGEGTVIEPTHRFGYQYLEELQQRFNAPDARAPENMRLPVQLYLLKKRLPEQSPHHSRLQSATDLLFNDQPAKARAILEAVSKAP